MEDLRLIAHGPPPAGHELALSHIATLHARLRALRNQRPDLCVLDDVIASVTDLGEETERLHSQAHAWQKELDELLQLGRDDDTPTTPHNDLRVTLLEQQLVAALRKLGAEHRRASQAEAACDIATTQLTRQMNALRHEAALQAERAAEAELTARVCQRTLVASLQAAEEPVQTDASASADAGIQAGCPRLSGSCDVGIDATSAFQELEAARVAIEAALEEAEAHRALAEAGRENAWTTMQTAVAAAEAGRADAVATI